MKSYPKYRDSGIIWIGTIPEHWSVKRIKDLAVIYAGATPSSKNNSYWDGDIIWVTPADMTDFGYISKGSSTITELGYNSCGSHLVPSGSIIISSRAPIGKVNIAAQEMCTNQGCKSLVLNSDVNGKFIAYYLYNESTNIDACGQGTTFKELSLKNLVGYKVILPPLNEQIAIASYLDEKCGEIDGQVDLLEKKQKAYERLKTTIINDAVTHGLNHNVTMRPSDIDWIGDIPAHWKVRRFKEMFSSYTTGITPESKNDKYFEVSDGYTWVTIADMTSKYVSRSNLNLSQTAVDLFQPVMTVKGSLMFSFKLSIGKVSFAQKDLYTNEAIVSIPPHEGFDLNFIYYLLPKILLLNATENIYGAKMLNQKIIANMKIMFPPIEEQRSIAAYLDEKCGEIDAAVENIGKQIDAYKRLKKSLINEVVTGKRAV